jgi:outer membrane protein assembly factor BamB
MRGGWALCIGIWALGAGGAAVASSGGSEDAVAVQINIAHSGSTVFAAGFAPPLTKIWSADLGLGENMYSHALVAGGAVYVVANGIELFAVDLETGATKWTHALKCCHNSGAYDNGTLFYVNDQGEAVALSAESGTQLWRKRLNYHEPLPLPPMATGGQLFVGAGQAVYALDETSGHVEWSQSVPGDSSSPAFGDGGVYVEYPCHFYKLSPENGTALWTNSQTCFGGGGDIPAYYDNRVYFGDTDDDPVVADSGSGATVGTYPAHVPPAMFAEPKHGKTRGVTLSNGLLTCWNPKTGKVTWTFTGDGELLGAPIAVNGTVFVGSLDGNLYALDAANGKTVWSDNLGWQIENITAGEGTLIVLSNTSVTAYRPR